MAYRFDKDLEFLGEMSSADLNDLVDILTKDDKGGSRWTGELTGSDAWKAYTPDHSRYWQLIAAELQCFGANTMVTFVRGGKGVLYREVLADVCEKSKVKDMDKTDNIMEVEDKLLNKLLADSLEKMSVSERAEFAKAIGATALRGAFTAEALAATAQLAFKAGGFKSFQLTLLVANATSKALLGRGLTLAGNAALMRTASVLTGPIGWAITGAWTVAVDVAGPAFRITLPAVAQVALLRKKYEAKRQNTLNDIERELNEI